MKGSQVDTALDGVLADHQAIGLAPVFITGDYPHNSYGCDNLEHKWTKSVFGCALGFGQGDESQWTVCPESPDQISACDLIADGNAEEVCSWDDDDDPPFLDDDDEESFDDDDDFDLDEDDEDDDDDDLEIDEFDDEEDLDELDEDEDGEDL